MKNKSLISVVNLIGFTFLMYASFLFRENDNMFNAMDINPVFMPAPYAFSIWGIIYALLFLWIMRGFFAKDKEISVYENTGIWTFICIVLTGSTILVPVKASAILIIGALVTALIVYKKIQKSNVSYLYTVPFSLLAGWLSVATIVDISLVLKSMGITSLLYVGEIGWIIILLVVGTIIAILFSSSNKDWMYPLVFVWGYIAIAIQNKDRLPIILVASGMCLVIILGIVFTTFQKKNLRKVKF